MRRIENIVWVSVVLVCTAVCGAGQQATAAGVPVDTAHSRLTVHVYRSGIFKFAADNHEIQAPIESGAIDASRGAVTLRVDPSKLKVIDPRMSAEKREEVQQRMLSPDVLDPVRFRAIEFRSTQVVAQGANQWLVHGELALHGETRPISLVVVRGATGQYSGSATLKQSDFGIKPITIAGGTVKVKDEVKVEFEIVTR